MQLNRFIEIFGSLNICIGLVLFLTNKTFFTKTLLLSCSHISVTMFSGQVRKTGENGCFVVDSLMTFIQIKEGMSMCLLLLAWICGLNMSKPQDDQFWDFSFKHIICKLKQI